MRPRRRSRKIAVRAQNDGKGFVLFATASKLRSLRGAAPQGRKEIHHKLLLLSTTVQDRRAHLARALSPPRQRTASSQLTTQHPPPPPLPLARLEQQHRHLPKVKVNVVVGLVRHVRAKVAANEAVPHAIVLRAHNERERPVRRAPKHERCACERGAGGD